MRIRPTMYRRLHHAIQRNQRWRRPTELWLYLQRISLVGGTCVDMPEPLLLEPSPSRRIVERIIAGERAAESELWHSYARGLRFLIRRRTRDEDLAQDVVQEAFRLAITQLRQGQLNNTDAVAAYLRGIALNVLAQSHRSGHREIVVSDDDPLIGNALDERIGPFEATSLEERRALVRRMIGELTVARDRELLRRYYITDEDKTTICADLGLSADHFDRVLHRARVRLRSLIVDAMSEPAAGFSQARS
jgi:RNA polymerase sigma-70 factor, ECF subfamily